MPDVQPAETLAQALVNRLVDINFINYEDYQFCRYAEHNGILNTYFNAKVTRVKIEGIGTNPADYAQVLLWLISQPVPTFDVRVRGKTYRVLPDQLETLCCKSEQDYKFKVEFSIIGEGGRETT